MYSNKISTVILSYNHPDLTAKCVEAALKYVAVQDLVLIHNGSLPQHSQVLLERFPSIDHHMIAQNAGFSAGANSGLNYAFKKSAWVFFITNDCQLLTAPQVPKYFGLVAPLIYRRNINIIDSLGATFQPLSGKLRHLRNDGKKKNVLKPFQYFYVPGTAFYLDAQSFGTIGGFDESLHTYWEDVDLSVRALKANIPLSIDTNTQLIHKVGKTCHKDPFYTRHLFQRNRKIVSSRYTPAILRPLQKIFFGIERQMALK